MQTEISSTDALALAAILPGTHAHAMDDLEDRLRVHFERTEDSFRLRMELAEAHGECLYDELLTLWRLDDALAAARRCGTQNDEAYVLMLMGRYAEAARLAQRPYLRAVIAIAERRWRDAATELEQAKRPCVSALARTFAGEPDAFSSISEPDAMCQVMRAFSLPPAEALGYLEHLPLASEAWGARSLRDQMASLLGSESMDRYEYAHALDRHDAEPTIWLAGARLRALPPASIAARSASYAQLMITALIRGDLRAARDHLARARALDQYGWWRWAELPLALFDASYPTGALRSRGGEQGEALALRATGTVRDRDFDPYERAQAAAIHAAWQGDGALLAQFLRTHDDPFPQTWNYIAVLPRVLLHRDELRRALRFVRERPWMSDAEVPFEVVEIAARTREMSRAIGDTEEVARWQSIIDRHVAVLADPQVVIALMFLREER